MEKKFSKKEIPSQQESFSKWYNAVVQKAELADYAPVRGCMVIRPYGFALWEAIQEQFNKQIRTRGVKNAYFPLFIPYSFIEKEKEHVEGFSPQLAVVTHGGGKKLEEPLVVRPTSETIINDMYAKWIKSYRDLPLLINQWCNVVRWEMRTYLFLRTSEFLWQEGHTAHKTHEEAYEFMLWAADEYRKLYEDFMAIPVVVGKKTKSETFPGALESVGVEALLPSGKALQASTSHDLGQNFAKAFGIEFQDEQGKLQHAWQTSWGLSTRSIGGLIMMHGDDNGLVLPPKIAPIQVVIMPISEKKEVVEYAIKIKEQLSSIERGHAQSLRVELDTNFTQSPGWRFNHWELKGVPIRLEIGDKEVKEKGVTVFRRDTGKKEFHHTPLNPLVENLLGEIQKGLFEKATRFQKENTLETSDYSKFKTAIEQGKFVQAPWCGSEACEAQIKNDTKATSRVIVKENINSGKCLKCGSPAKHLVLFAKAY